MLSGHVSVASMPTSSEHGWGYTAASHGPGSLDFTPNVSTAEAAQWGGLPLQEAGFPYGPIMAYVFSATVSIYRFMLHEPLVGMANTGAIDFELRAFNALAVIVDIAILHGVLQLQVSSFELVESFA